MYNFIKINFTIMLFEYFQDVGRSCILLTIGGKNIMMDCGMHMGYNDDVSTTIDTSCMFLIDTFND